MKFTIVTLFPDMLTSYFGASVIGNAIAGGKIEVDFVDPRQFATDKHRSVDDAPFGGGNGMLLRADLVGMAIDQAMADGVGHRIMMTPTGQQLDHKTVEKLAQKDHLVLVCGRYEGIDARIDRWIDQEISIGDFVLSGGELAAAAVVDAVARLIPGVLGGENSAKEESFSSHLLEHPHFTRPANLPKGDVPDILLSGHHQAIAQWRLDRAEELTAGKRPDLFAAYLRDNGPRRNELLGNVHLALVHHPVRNREGQTATTSVTNLDVHDIARLSATYGLGDAWVTSPIDAQRDKLSAMIDTWNTQEPEHSRSRAVMKLKVAPSLSEIKEVLGDPLVIATTADKTRANQARPARDVGSWLLSQRPILVVFGTGYGLTDDCLQEADHTLNPILERQDYNHLSVRSAMAVMIDRLFGAFFDDLAANAAIP